jgi:hypothetical protein
MLLALAHPPSAGIIRIRFCGLMAQHHLSASKIQGTPLSTLILEMKKLNCKSIEP